MNTAAPKGTYDVVPEDKKSPWKQSFAWESVIDAAVRSAHIYGCERIFTPLFEHIELFTRSVGESSDIVTKEMYDFKDRSDRHLSLRPEGPQVPCAQPSMHASTRLLLPAFSISAQCSATSAPKRVAFASTVSLA